MVHFFSLESPSHPMCGPSQSPCASSQPCSRPPKAISPLGISTSGICSKQGYVAPHRCSSDQSPACKRSSRKFFAGEKFPTWSFPTVEVSHRLLPTTCTQASLRSGHFDSPGMHHRIWMERSKHWGLRSPEGPQRPINFGQIWERLMILHQSKSGMREKVPAKSGCYQI